MFIHKPSKRYFDSILEMKQHHEDIEVDDVVVFPCCLYDWYLEFWIHEDSEMLFAHLSMGAEASDSTPENTWEISGNTMFDVLHSAGEIAKF